MMPGGLGTFTKPPQLQESRLTGGGSPNLIDLIEGKVPVGREVEAANNFQPFFPWLYTCAVQTADPNWFYKGILFLPLSWAFISTRTQPNGRADAQVL